MQDEFDSPRDEVLELLSNAVAGAVAKLQAAADGAPVFRSDHQLRACVALARMASLLLRTARGIRAAAIAHFAAGSTGRGGGTAAAFAGTLPSLCGGIFVESPRNESPRSTRRTRRRGSLLIHLDVFFVIFETFVVNGFESRSSYEPK